MSEQVSGGASGAPGAYTRKMTYVEFLDRSPMTLFLWILVIGTSFAQLLDGFDYMGLSFALPVLIKYFKINPTQAGLLGAATNLGLLLGGVAFAMLADRFGRRPILMIVLFTYAVGTGLCAVAPDYRWLLVFRVICGIGVGGEIPIVISYLGEYAPVKHRHWIVPVIPMMYSIGWLLAAALSIWLIPRYGWRPIFWIGLTPALMIIFVRQLMPESVRFLLLRGKTEEAGRIVRKLADRCGMRDVELVPPPKETGRAAKPGLRAQFAGLSQSMGALLVLSFMVCFTFVESYGLSAWLPTIFVREGITLVKSYWYAMLALVAQPFSVWIALWQQQKFQRKTALMQQLIANAGFFILFGLSFRFHESAHIAVVTRFLGILLGGGYTAILFTLCAELFPTGSRSLGAGIITGAGRIGAMLGPFALGLFISLGRSVDQIVFMFAVPLVLAAVLVVVVIKVDPRSKALEEVMKAHG